MLAGSNFEIGSRDARSMLVLSDASGPGVRTDDRGYPDGIPTE